MDIKIESLRIDHAPSRYRVQDQPVAFTRDYRGGGAFHAQFEKGARQQWSVNDPELFDWNAPLDPALHIVPDETHALYGTPCWHDAARQDGGLEALRRDILSEQLSQLLHGEQGALKVTSQLVAALEDCNAQLAAGLQVGDEARHVEFFRHALARLGKVYPPNPAIQQLIDAAMREPHPHLKFVAMQILIEGLALAAIGGLRKALAVAEVAGGGDVLLLTGLHYVMRDEARHLALGILSLRGQVAVLNDAARRESEDFVFEGFRSLWQHLLPRFACEERGFDPEEMYEVARSLRPLSTGFRNSLIRGVLPQAYLLGLVPERMRDRYTKEFEVDWARVTANAATLQNEGI